MSKKRRRPGRGPLGVGAVVAAAILAVLLTLLIGRLILGALSLTRPGASGAPDPQFAEPAETVTRPPEMAGEGQPPEREDDPSAGWEQVQLTPVDKTAEELGREAEADD